MCSLTVCEQELLFLDVVSKLSGVTNLKFSNYDCVCVNLAYVLPSDAMMALSLSWEFLKSLTWDATSSTNFLVK